MENGMTPDDIGAIMGNRDGEGFGGGAWWIIILFLFVFMGGGCWGNRQGDYSQYATAASQQQILFNQQFDQMNQRLTNIGNGICDSTYALNNSTAGGRASALCADRELLLRESPRHGEPISADRQADVRHHICDTCGRRGNKIADPY